MHWQPVGCVLHGNKVKSFNWTLSTCTTLCVIYITEQQVTPRRSNVYVSSQLSSFKIYIGNEYSWISLFLLRCNLCLFFVLVTCCTAKGGSIENWWRLYTFHRIWIAHYADLLRTIPIGFQYWQGFIFATASTFTLRCRWGWGRKAPRSCVECLES
jgi:ABC-type Fe3+ transport system permease subunit